MSNYLHMSENKVDIGIAVLLNGYVADSWITRLKEQNDRILQQIKLPIQGTKCVYFCQNLISGWPCQYHTPQQTLISGSKEPVRTFSTERWLVPISCSIFFGILIEYCTIAVSGDASIHLVWIQEFERHFCVFGQQKAVHIWIILTVYLAICQEFTKTTVVLHCQFTA